MSRDILEASLRAFVAKGAGIPSTDVVQGNQSSAAPNGLYASVTLIHERRRGRQARFQRIGAEHSYTTGVNRIQATFSIQFYRDGAIAAAQRFADWSNTETALNWSSTAIVDGSILGANVYAGGQGYLDGERCVFSAPDQPSPVTQATGYITTNARGECNGIIVDHAGGGYWEKPQIVIVSAGGSGAMTSPRGYGFDIESPIGISNISGMIAGDTEERAQIDFTILYDRPIIDNESGRVERIVGERESDGASVTSDSDASGTITPPTTPTEDTLVYVFQTNLIPQNPDTNTIVGDGSDGIAIDRIAEWSKAGNHISATGTGFFETTIFSSNPIVPQHGRDLIATSPFITNYEGNIVATTTDLPSNTVYNAIYYIKTTHFIPNQPNITSVRAFKHNALQWGDTGFSVQAPLSDFNSMVLLNNAIPNGGVIGLQLDFGVGFMATISQENIDQLLKELNTQATLSITPRRTIDFTLSGFNTRVTFLQYDLSTAG